MDVPLIELVKIQAQILVPIVKALRVELGRERANDVVRRTLGDLYRRYGQEFRRRKDEENVGHLMASAFVTYARGGASTMNYASRHTTASRSRSHDASTPPFSKRSESPNLASCWSAAQTFRWPKALIPTSSLRARRLSCRALAAATSTTTGSMIIEQS
jgi:hypothetical protein